MSKRAPSSPVTKSARLMLVVDRLFDSRRACRAHRSDNRDARRIESTLCICGAAPESNRPQSAAAATGGLETFASAEDVHSSSGHG